MYMCTLEDDFKTEIRLSFIENNVLRTEKPAASENRSNAPSSMGHVNNPNAAPIVPPPLPNNKDRKIQIVPVTFKTERTVYPLKLTAKDKEQERQLSNAFKAAYGRVPRRNYNVAQLYKAIHEGRVEDVRFSLRYIDVHESRDDHGHTPIIAAMLSRGGKTRRLEMLDLLLRRGMDVHARDRRHQRTAFGWGCYLGRVEELQRLSDALEGDVDYEDRDTDGNTYLILAVMSKNFETVRYLVEDMERMNLSMDAANDIGVTPYILARKMGLKDIADLLAQKKGLSKQKSDESIFRTPREWSILGQVERTAQEEAELFQKERLRGRRVSRKKPYLPKLGPSLEEQEFVNGTPYFAGELLQESADEATYNYHSSLRGLSPLGASAPPLPKISMNLPITQPMLTHTEGVPEAASTQWLHDAFLLWSGQHNPVYRHPAAALKMSPSALLAHQRGPHGRGNKSKNAAKALAKSKRTPLTHTPNPQQHS